MDYQTSGHEYLTGVPTWPTGSVRGFDRIATQVYAARANVPRVELRGKGGGIGGVWAFVDSSAAACMRIPRCGFMLFYFPEDNDNSNNDNDDNNTKQYFPPAFLCVKCKKKDSFLCLRMRWVRAVPSAERVRIAAAGDAEERRLDLARLCKYPGINLRGGSE